MKRFAFRPARAAAVVLIGAALPLAAAASANASNTLWGCTVDPKDPVFDHINDNGDKVILYQYEMTCAAGRTVEVEQHIHENDPNSYTHITDNTRSTHFSSADTVTKGWLNTLPQADVSGAEEMVHLVKFRVTLDNLSQSGWTAFDYSAEQQFSN